MSPKVSVIIPVYNVEKYIRRCLDSVFAQTLGDIEVLCVDDGSTDATPEILAEYAAAHPNLVVERQQNAGSSVARNRALDLASGEYVSFVDSDDWFARKDALAVLTASADELHVDELFFDVEVSSESSELLAQARESLSYYHVKRGDYPDVLDGQSMYLRLLRNDDILDTLWSHVYRRAFLEENHLRFVPGILHQDSVFTLECSALSKRSAYCRGQFYHRYFRPGSSMTGENRAHSCYSGSMGYRALDTFASERLDGANPEFLRAYRGVLTQFEDKVAQRLRELPRQERAAFLKRQSAPVRADIRRHARASTSRRRRRELRLALKARVPAPLWSLLKKLKAR